MADEDDETGDAELRERFRFMRERAFAGSTVFVDRVIGAIRQRLAAPEESLATTLFVELTNLLSSFFGRDQNRDRKDEE
jgi:hypothetical protein